MSLEGVGLLVSDPALVVLVEMVPGALEVGIQISWHLSWLELVGGLQDGSCSELGIVLHEELLAGLVAGWGSAFPGVAGEDAVHNLVLVGAIVAGDVLGVPGALIDVSAFSVRVVESGDSNSADLGH